MNLYARMFSIVACGGLFVCAPVYAQNVAVKVDYDHSAPLNAIKSYTYGKVQASDPLLEPRITAAIDRVMQGEGFHLVSGNATVVINAIYASKSSDEYGQFYKSLARFDSTRGWGKGGFTDEDANAANVAVGTLVVDMYNPATGKLEWRGTAVEPPQQKHRKIEDDIDKGVARMFANFPPKSAGPVAPNQVEVPQGSGRNRTTGNH